MPIVCPQCNMHLNVCYVMFTWTADIREGGEVIFAQMCHQNFAFAVAFIYRCIYLFLLENGTPVLFLFILFFLFQFPSSFLYFCLQWETEVVGSDAVSDLSFRRRSVRSGPPMLMAPSFAEENSHK